MMATDSRPQSKDQQETTKKYNLPNFADGEDDCDTFMGGSIYPVNTKHLSEFSDVILKMQRAAVNFSDKKHLKKQNAWSNIFPLAFLGVITIFALIVGVNPGKHFSNEHQDAAIKLLFSQVATLLAYLYGKKVGEEA
jgi:hypothetical protein